MLTPEQHTALNEGYWNSKRSVADIRREFELTESELAKQLVPQPTGASCWFCHEPVTYASRRVRNEAQRPYGQLRCRCGAKQPQLPPSLAGIALRPSDALIVGPTCSTSSAVATGVGGARASGASTRPRRLFGERLGVLGHRGVGEVGLAWSGTSHTIERTPIRRSSSPSWRPQRRDDVLPSVSHVMANEGDSLALFFTLVLRGWRVISAATRGRSARASASTGTARGKTWRRRGNGRGPVGCRGVITGASSATAVRDVRTSGMTGAGVIP